MPIGVIWLIGGTLIGLAAGWLLVGNYVAGAAGGFMITLALLLVGGRRGERDDEIDTSGH